MSANKNVEVLGRQVYIKLPGFGRGRFVDILIRNKTGQLIAVEIKSGGATRNASQIAKNKVIASGRGTSGENVPTGLKMYQMKLL